MRFRKSIKILPGVRVNLSKSGLSTTFGIRGLSVNTGKNGTYLNTGISGTGLYNRQRIDDGTNMSYSSGIREAKRNQRELEKMQKQLEKLNELEKASLEVTTYNNYIDRLLSIHKDCYEEHNWIEIAKKEQPLKQSYGEFPYKKEVIPIHKDEEFYRELLSNYKPNFFEKLFGKDKKTIKKWEETLNKVIIENKNNTTIEIEKAEKEYLLAVENYKKRCEEIDNQYVNDVNDYNTLIDLAKKVNNGDLSAYAYVIENLAPFNELSEFGSEIDCTVTSKTQAKAVINVNDITVIPKQSKTLLKSGKVSIKDMPIGKFNEIYQDYVCSAVLRMARDLFSILPFEEIIITAIGGYINSSTGNEEEGPILSVLFNRKIFETLNFESLDPSDSMQNFKCNMEFKKTKGMTCTEEVEF